MKNPYEEMDTNLNELDDVLGELNKEHFSKKVETPKTQCTCNYCLKPYDKAEVKRTLGKESYPYLLGYCSAQCYTKMTMRLMEENKLTGEIEGERRNG